MTEDPTQLHDEDKFGSTEKLIEALELAEASGQVPVLEIELSSGVKLRLQPTPKHYIFQVTQHFEPPSVPEVWLEKKQRSEKNPNDPDYQLALELYAVEVANAATDTTILRGTEVISVPDGVPTHNDQVWIDEMTILGMPMVESEIARYLAWVKAIAAPLDRDVEKLLEALGRLTGVAESDVLDAVEKFRRVAERPTDSEPSGSGG